MPERKIGDRTYKAEKLPATEATRTLLRLTKILGPALPKLQAAIAGGEGGRDGAALEAIAELLMFSDADDLTNFLVSVAEQAMVKNPGHDYDQVQYDLIPDLLEAFQVVAFVLQVNYRDFFGGKLGSVLSGAAKAA